MKTWARVVGAGRGVCLGGLLAALAACGSPDAGSSGTEGLGSVRFNLSLAPSTARCAMISAEPAMGVTVTRSFELGPGQPGVFSVEGLPTGMVNLTEQVFTVSCAVLMAEMPAWVSDPVAVTLGAGVSQDISFSLHKAGAGGQVSVASDFPRTQPVMTEFTLPAMSDPARIVAGPDGKVWFTEPQANKIVRVDSVGVATEFPLPTDGVQPTAIASGPDDCLWFTEASAAMIGRITTSGAIREFAIPSGSPAVGIITGPDGNVWFLETTRVGRITPTGTVTEVTVVGHPKSIAPGPDGNVWFGAEYFGRINTTTLANVSLSGVGFNKSVNSLVAGSDGSMWFTVSNNSSGPIGRVTMTGVKTYFPLPETMQTADFITAGPDGSLWFTDSGKGAIGRITTAGVISDFLTPSDSTPNGIAAGPQGTLWYTDSRGKIGRVQP